MSRWFFACFFGLIGSEFIDIETCTRVFLQIFCGKYLNWPYRSASLTGLCKVVTRVPVGCSNLLTSIDCFSWYKISLKFFVQAFFYWFFNAVYYIYCISTHCSLNLSSGVLEHFQRAVSKPDIRICFPHRFVEGRGRGDDFCYLTCRHQYIDWIQGSYSSYSSLKLCR